MPKRPSTRAGSACVVKIVHKARGSLGLARWKGMGLPRGWIDLGPTSPRKIATAFYGASVLRTQLAIFARSNTSKTGAAEAKRSRRLLAASDQETDF